MRVSGTSKGQPQTVAVFAQSDGQEQIADLVDMLRKVGFRTIESRISSDSANLSSDDQDLLESSDAALIFGEGAAANLSRAIIGSFGRKFGRVRRPPAHLGHRMAGSKSHWPAGQGDRPCGLTPANALPRGFCRSTD